MLKKRKTLDELLDQLHDDAKYVDAVANYFTVTNLGARFGQIVHWHELCEGDTEALLEEEYDDWRKEGRQLAVEIKLRGLPLSLRSADKVWQDPKYKSVSNIDPL